VDGKAFVVTLEIVEDAVGVEVVPEDVDCGTSVVTWRDVVVVTGDVGGGSAVVT